MAGAATHFERLDLPRRFALEPAQIERNYLARSRESHPDFHQQASASEQLASIEASAALNEAYATLKNPFRRAEYLLALEGGPSAAEHKALAPGFLEEMLDLRMEIEELRAEPAGAPGRRALETQLTQRTAALAQAVADRFASLDRLPLADSSRQRELLQVRQHLNAARYLQGLLRDLRAD